MNSHVCSKCGFMLDYTDLIDQLFDLRNKIKCWVCGYVNEFDNEFIPQVDSKFRVFLTLPQ